MLACKSCGPFSVGKQGESASAGASVKCFYAQRRDTKDLIPESNRPDGVQ